MTPRFCEINVLGLGPMCLTPKHPRKRMPEIWASGTEKCGEKRFKTWTLLVVTPSEGEQRPMLKRSSQDWYVGCYE